MPDTKQTQPRTLLSFLKPLKWSVLIVFTVFAAQGLMAQTPYSSKKYAFDTLRNVVYGSDTDYAGNPVTLLMDIYKPLGDSNCLRPVMVLVHGGAWIGGSKEDADIVFMARELAAMGWVVSCINYRLGTHKTASYNMYALCNNSISAPCGYICDSAEVYRANFRAMQDAKGAIRYMKSRSQTDSSDAGNVFIAGQSAGGFIALACAFTDRNAEKDSSCYAIADAPVPDADLAAYGCVPGSLNLSRPDLGSIEGRLHRMAGIDAGVKGVGNFFGGVLQTGLFVQNADSPWVYLYHQGSDVVVHYLYGRLLGRISYECFAPGNICQPYYFYPSATGSEGIRRHLNSSWPASHYRADVIGNYSYGNNCFSNGHSIDNIGLRLKNMTDLFVGRILLSGNNPAENCRRSGLGGRIFYVKPGIQPNPAGKSFQIAGGPSWQGAEYLIIDSGGRTVMSGILENGFTECSSENLRPGIYHAVIRLNGNVSLAVVQIQAQ